MIVPTTSRTEDAMFVLVNTATLVGGGYALLGASSLAQAGLVILGGLVGCYLGHAANGIAHMIVRERRMNRPTPGDTAQTSYPVPPEIQNVIKHPVLVALEKAGGEVPSNRALAELMRVSPGEASKKHQEVAHLLRYHRDGKAVRISLAS